MLPIIVRKSYKHPFIPDTGMFVIEYGGAGAFQAVCQLRDLLLSQRYGLVALLPCIQVSDDSTLRLPDGKRVEREIPYGSG